MTMSPRHKEKPMLKMNAENARRKEDGVYARKEEVLMSGKETRGFRRICAKSQRRMTTPDSFQRPSRLRCKDMQKEQQR